MLRVRGAPFPVDQVVGWGDQLLTIVQYLHEQQPPVIHRDIKLLNLKLRPNGKLVLLDFGIAKGGLTVRTISDSIPAGTIGYAPLEQLKRWGTDERSDLHAVGATLWRLLTNDEPIDVPVCVNKQSLAESPIRCAQPTNSSRTFLFLISQALERAVALDPNQRPSSAAVEMRQHVTSGGGTSATGI